VPVIIREDLTDEDEKLKKLLVANFGRSKNDPVKQGRVYKEYETLRGVQHGGARPDNRVLVTQADIAKELGISVSHLQEIKRLQTLSPDLQDLISEGKITATTGYKVLAKLSPEEQEELIQSMDATNKVTQKELRR
jgi:ParB-like chromosome segregation protein Spo0J